MNDKDYEAVLQRVRDDRDKYRVQCRHWEQRWKDVERCLRVKDQYKAALDRIAHYVAETAASPDMYYDYPVLLKRILEDAGWRGDDE